MGNKKRTTHILSKRRQMRCAPTRHFPLSLMDVLVVICTAVAAEHRTQSAPRLPCMAVGLPCKSIGDCGRLPSLAESSWMALLRGAALAQKSGTVARRAYASISLVRFLFPIVMQIAVSLPSHFSLRRSAHISRIFCLPLVIGGDV